MTIRRTAALHLSTFLGADGMIWWCRQEKAQGEEMAEGARFLMSEIPLCRQEKAQGEEMAEAGRASPLGKNANTNGGFGKNTNARNLNVSGAWITPSGTHLEMCSGSEAGSYLRLIGFVYHSTLGLRVINKKKKSTPLHAPPSTLHAPRSMLNPPPTLNPHPLTLNPKRQSRKLNAKVNPPS